MAIVSNGPCKSNRSTSIEAILATFVSAFGTMPVPGEKLLATLGKSELIDLFQYYVFAWILDPAICLLERRQKDGNPNTDGDHAVFQILNAVPEFLGRCISGSLGFHDSYIQFTIGMQYILKANRLTHLENSSEEADQHHHDLACDLMYFYVRNGLSHSLFTRKVVMVARRLSGGWQEYTMDPKNAISNYAICMDLGKLTRSDIEVTFPRIDTSANKRRFLEKRNLRLWLDAEYFFRLVLVALDIYVSALNDAAETDVEYNSFRTYMTAGN